MTKKSANKKSLVVYGCEWTIDGKEDSDIFMTYGRCMEKVANQIVCDGVFCEVEETPKILCINLLYIDHSKIISMKNNEGSTASFLIRLGKEFGKEVHCHIQGLELTMEEE